MTGDPDRQLRLIIHQHQQGKLKAEIEMSRLMLNRDELIQIKAELKQELREEFRETINRSIAIQVTGASGRILKKIVRILSLNLGVELKLPKDMK